MSRGAESSGTGSGGTEEWERVLAGLVRGERVAHVRVTGVIMGLLVQQRLFDLREHWDDICQEVLLKLIQSARSGVIREASAFVGYCSTITRRESYRWMKRQAETRLESAPAETEAASQERDRDPEVLVQVARALDALPEKSRQVMDAIYLRGYTYQEAADRLGIPLGTLKRLQTGALRELRETMETRP